MIATGPHNLAALRLRQRITDRPAHAIDLDLDQQQLFARYQIEQCR